MKKYWQKIRTIFVEAFKTGISAQKLAISVVIGTLLGIMPFFGASTALCAFIALYFRLNMPIIQVVNYVVYPLQLMLFIPFIRLGETIFGANPLPLDMVQIQELAQKGILILLEKIWLSNLYALVAWSLAGFLVGSVLYFCLFFVFKRLLNKAKFE